MLLGALRLKHSVALPEVTWLSYCCWTNTFWFGKSLFSHGNWSVLNWGMSAFLHVRPLTRGSVRDDSQAFVVSRCFFVLKIPQILVQKAWAGRRSGCPRGVLDSWSQQSHGINLWGQKPSWSAVSKVPSTVSCLTSQFRLRRMKTRHYSVFYVSHCNPGQTRRAKTHLHS